MKTNQMPHDTDVHRLSDWCSVMIWPGAVTIKYQLLSCVSKVKCFLSVQIAMHWNFVFITARIRRMTGGYVFTGVCCLSTLAGGGGSQVRTGWVPPPIQDRTGLGTPPPSSTGWGTPLIQYRSGWGTPSPIRRQALATRRAVCLLCSRRISLFWFFLFWEIHTSLHTGVRWWIWRHKGCHTGLNLRRVPDIFHSVHVIVSINNKEEQKHYLEKGTNRSSRDHQVHVFVCQQSGWDFNLYKNITSTISFCCQGQYRKQASYSMIFYRFTL